MQTHPLRRALAVAALLLATSTVALAGSPRITHHAVDVTVDPAQGRVSASDTISFDRDGGGVLRFRLNSGLLISSVRIDGRDVLEPRKAADDGWTVQWELDVPPGPGEKGSVVVTYAGSLLDEVREGGSLSFTVGDDTRGLISEQGAYLSPGSAWYPDDRGVARFDLSVRSPAPYLAVTQGTLIERTTDAGADVTRWKGKHSADGLYLVVGKWQRFERQVGGLTVGAYLGADNAAGAPLLLDAAANYLARYGDLLGNYAYDRFDIVENWFTTGYGMPEFTLLGQHVIGRMLYEAQRHGAIPAGYLDHEIVHCWWGNLVYPNYERGNWCEGLTTYCSNYMAKEWESADAAREHRRRAALRFSLRVDPEREYAVRQFRGKSEDADDDIGYGKCSMLFHMLRRDIGDEAFWQALRNVATERAGQRADWADWQAAFEKTSGRVLSGFFTQWLDRVGAPKLEIVDARVQTQGGRMRVMGTLRQVLGEDEQPWQITVPVVVEHLEGREELLVDLSTAELPFSMLVPSMPLRVVADPDHHVFRKFHPEELPPCLAATLESKGLLVVYPDGDKALEAVAQRVVATKDATALAASEAPIALPSGRSVLVLGDPERVPLLKTLRGIVPSAFPNARSADDTTILSSVRSPVDSRHFLTTFVGPPEALEARSRALFYYQFDGRIEFVGRAPRSRTDGATKSPASRLLLPPLAAAADPARAAATITRLCAEDLDGRKAGTPGDRATRKYLVEQLVIAGFDVRPQEFTFDVKRLPDGLQPLRSGATSIAGALPFTASPPTKEPLTATRVATDPGDDVTGAALLLDLPATSEDPLGFVRQTADMARARGAKFLVVRLAPAAPEDESEAPRRGGPRAADLWTFPGHLDAETAARIAARVAAGGNPDENMFAAGVAARTGSVDELALPTIMVPAGTEIAPNTALTADIRFDRVQIKSANVVGRLSVENSRDDRVVVLGAHFDQLGTGFAGADDNASGVAALLEAANILSANRTLLGRDVEIVFFGAEEWGLRGSRAYVAERGENHRIVAMVNADTVGQRAAESVHVVGISTHPRLGKVVAAAVEQADLVVGSDIDRFAFAHGSDHYPFHVAGIRAVDLWSGDYKLMDTREDVAANVDPEKVARIGRALALSALALSAGF